MDKSLIENRHISYLVKPGNPLTGEICGEAKLSLPGDKSISHRAALFAALADGSSKFDNFLVSGVTLAMLRGLKSFGILWKLSGDTLEVKGNGLSGLNQPDEAINCENSATTLRLLAGAIAASGVEAVLDGSEGLRRRPMSRIIKPLSLMGVSIRGNNGCAPLAIQSGRYPLHSINYTLPVASAQVKTCLLLAALAADGDSVIQEPGPSRDHTERMLQSMGVEVDSQLTQYPWNRHQSTIPAVFRTKLTPPYQNNLSPLRMLIPGDISSAAFLIIAALIVPGSSITLRHVGINPTRTGLLDALMMMGANIKLFNVNDKNREPFGDIEIHASDLEGIEVSGPLVVRMIDEFPVFAIAAAHARGKTIVRDARELRHKETDRISVLCGEIQKLGVDVTEQRDGFEISGGRYIQGAVVEAHGDHRLGMALSVAGLSAQEPVLVRDANIIAESFPKFESMLRYLGADIDVVDQS